MYKLTNILAGATLAAFFAFAQSPANATQFPQTNSMSESQFLGWCADRGGQSSGASGNRIACQTDIALVICTFTGGRTGKCDSYPVKAPRRPKGANSDGNETGVGDGGGGSINPGNSRPDSAGGDGASGAPGSVNGNTGNGGIN